MDNLFMHRAKELAKKRAGFTSPNPCVGACIVKGGKVVAQGWHKKAGADHAEIMAIKNLMNKSGLVTVDLDPNLFHNAYLYVTLEPCFHRGKTPPCARAIVEAGFKNVCVGMKDPSKKVNGKGIKFLRDHGVKVEICKDRSLVNEIRSLNQDFIKFSHTGLPYVTLKAAISLDGKIATSADDSKWITSEKARKHARLLRSQYDAVLVGARTILNDDSELAAHGKFRSKKLLRVIIDRKLRLSVKKKVFRDENVFVACTTQASERNKLKFRKAGIKFKTFGRDDVSIKRLLKYLASNKEVMSVFVEGGGVTHGYFHDAALTDRNIVDRIQFYIAPKLIGGNDALSAIEGNGVKKINKALKFQKWNIENLDEDIFVDGFLNFY